jgi:molybdopterin synthase catalytic subunit
MGVVIAEMSDRPLDVAAHLAAVRDSAGGADVYFAGVVRDHDHGQSVTAIEYLAYTGAEAVLREVAAEIAADPAVLAVAVSHRVGHLVVGDAALVDEVKARLPVWKRQVFADGTDEWVNCA